MTAGRHTGADGRETGTAAALFAGPGEMRALCRAKDWAATPLGPVEEWPASLRTVVSLVLGAPAAMIVLWGPDLVQLYNDGYRELMGAKHPAGLGQPTRECWPEVWAFTEPVYEGVMRRGESFTFTDQRLVLERNGHPEEAFFTLGYGPAPDGAGGVGGVLVTVFETTAQVHARGAREAERERLLHEAQASRDAAERGAVAAAASEARYRALFESIDVGFCVIEVLFDGAGRPVDYRFVEANPAFTQQTGLTDAVGHTARALVPSLEEHWFRTYGRVATTGEPVRFRNGSEPMGRWFEVYAFRVGAPEEHRVALLFTDVSAAHAAERERERLLAELGAERERLRSLVLQMPAPVALLEGPEHRFALVNDAYRRVSGGGRDVTGLTPPEAFPELAGQGIYELFDRVYETGEPWDGPETPMHYDRDGTGVQETWFDLRFEPLRDAEGRVVAIFNFAVDVTDQVRARHGMESLLRASEQARADAEAARAEAESLRRQTEQAAQVTSMITTHLAEGVCMMDAGGRLTYMNPAAERILGWSEEELRGDILHDRVHYKYPDGRPFPMHECPLGQVLGEGRTVLGLADQWVRRDGSFVHVVTTCSPIVQDGRVVGAVLSLHDDTERRRAEAERERLLAAEREARAEAETANRSKSEFLAVMSHELRTPLNAIGGYAELLEMEIRGPLTEAQRADLQRIQQSQRHLLGLINEVLNYARLETGAVHYELDDVPVAQAIAAAEALVAPQVRARGLAYTLDGCDPRLAVRADAEKLRQILLNLFSNAVKFTDRDGRIEVAVAEDSGTVAISVSDTGRGVPEEKLGSIFEPFVQVDARLTRTQDGVGLGLAISRDLARGMGGDLVARSQVGVGSTFTLTLPRAGGGDESLD